MKRGILCLGMLLLGVVLFVVAQSKVVLTYDADGNLIQRRVITLAKSSHNKISKSESVIENIDLTNKLRIYPNPTRGIIKIHIDSLSTKEVNRIRLYTTQGDLLNDRKVDSNSSSLDLSSYATGVYLLDIQLGSRVRVFKIIKQ